MLNNSSSEVKWCHRTDLSLDLDYDTLWYTQFRGQICLYDIISGNLQLGIYFIEKLSPRLTSLDQSTLESIRLNIGQSILNDATSLFKKPLKWMQLIGILNPGENSLTNEPQGMYTITARFNPNPEASPRFFSQSITQSSNKSGKFLNF